jgi:Ca-activated chloride channel family protein
MSEAAAGLQTTEQQPVPLAGVSVQADLVGRGARVEVTQVFENQGSASVEAVYRFPLPEGAALAGFRVEVGERVLAGEIEERDRAFERYDQALEAGDGAYLLDEERPNVFTLSVGNLNPGAKAVVTLTYVESLEARGAEVRFTLPTTISPRYLPADAPDEDGIPAADRIHPEYAPDVPYGFALLVRVHGGRGVASVESPSHAVRCLLDEDPLRVELASESVCMDRDFVLTVRYRDELPSRAWAVSHRDERFLQVDLTIPEPEAPPSEVAGELVFLLDCSGSMQGSSIDEARRALEIFLRAVPEAIWFNVYRFGSEFHCLWNRPRPATPDHVTEALAHLGRVQADLGGTEILAPLRAIYAQEPARGIQRNIVLITDGEVGNESDVVELARSRPGEIRVFTVGIGHGPNDYLIRQTARASGAVSLAIAPEERIEPKVLELFAKVMAPGIRELRIEGPAGFEQAPREPTVFPGETMSLFGRWTGPGRVPESVTVLGRIGDETRGWTVPVSGEAGSLSPIPQLWAREAIRDLEEGAPRGSRQTGRKQAGLRGAVVELSKRYGVVSRETSFVAVEARKEVDKTLGEVVLRKVPVLVTHGWHGGAFGRVGAYSPSPTGRASLLDALAEPLASITRFPRRSRASRTSDRLASADDVEGGLLYELLATQRPGGGFYLDRGIARRLGASHRKLRGFADWITMESEGEPFPLLCTALVLAVLEIRFAEDETVWGAIVAKSRRWLAVETARLRPELNGQPLGEWVADFARKLELDVS